MEGVDFSDAILMLIANNEVDAALTMMIEFYKKTDENKYAELIFASNRLKQIQKEKLLGISNNLEFENKILMLLIQSARDLRTKRVFQDDKRVNIQIKINKDINELTEKLKDNLVFTLSTILNTNLHDIQIINTREGSIIFELSLPSKVGKTLTKYYSENTFHIRVINTIFGLSEIKDKELIKTHQQKSAKDIFEDEFINLMDMVLAFCYRLTSDMAQAEELTQETYLKAWRFIESYKLGTNAKAWLFRIARNIFINQYRSKKEEKIENKPNPKLTDDITTALNELNETMRAVVLLDLENFSYQEMSEILNIPIGTVRSRLFRARNILAENLQTYSEGNEAIPDADSKKIINFIGDSIGDERLSIPSPGAN